MLGGKITRPVSGVGAQAVCLCSVLLILSCLLTLEFASAASASASASTAAVGAVASSTPPPPIGVVLVPLSSALAEDVGLPQDRRGLLVLGVYKGSPAESSGLAPGDVIIKVRNSSGKTVETPDLEKFKTATDAIPAGKPVDLTILRAGKEITFSIMRTTGTFGPVIQPPARTEPRIITVAADGSGDARTTYGAVLKSRPGDTVLLRDGEYQELWIWWNGISVRPAEPGARVSVTRIVIDGASEVLVQGLAVAGTAASSTLDGISISRAARVTIRDCKVQGFLVGVKVSGSTDVVLEGNTITGNTGGVVIQSQSQAKVTRNLVKGNAVSRAEQDRAFCGGIQVSYSKVELSNNTIIENRVSPDTFVKMVDESNGVLVPGIGVQVVVSAQAVVYNNIIAFNNVGFMALSDTRFTLEYNDVYGQQIQTKTWSPRAFVERQLRGARSDFLSGIRMEFTMPPLFSSEPTRTVYTPFLEFQPSATNLSVDPLFADVLSGDYRLAADSPLATKGRGGGYIGAFPPVGSRETAVAVAGSDAGPTATAAQSGQTGGPGRTDTAEPKPGAVVRGGVLRVDPELLDQLVAELHKRAEDSQQTKDALERGFVGVIPFELVGIANVTLSTDFIENLSTSLINSGLQPADAVRVNGALAELGIQHSGQVSREIASQLKEKADCAFLLLGTIAGQPSTIVINARLMDTATGRFLAAGRLEAVLDVVQ